jgi:hypothetical protein
MALTITPGGASDDSYASTAEASAYADSRGLTFAVAGDDAPLAEQALRRATAWVDATYRARFPGYRVNAREQALEWPRYDAYDTEGNYIESTVVPVEIINATIEAAIREKASPGALSPDVTPGTVKKRVRVEGAVEVEYAVGAGGVRSQVPISTVIDGLLGSLLSSPRNIYGGKAVRA